MREIAAEVDDVTPNWAGEVVDAGEAHRPCLSDDLGAAGSDSRIGMAGLYCDRAAPVASSAACRIASTMLPASALPVPAMSKAVP